MMIPSSTQVSGLDETGQDVFRGLLRQWERKRERNILRRSYRDMHVILNYLGASVPTYMRDALNVVCGWPGKAVTALAARCMWDGITVPSGAEDPFDLSMLLHANRFSLEVPQAIDAELTYSCSFMATLPGDVQAGDPAVIVSSASAEWATGIWDYRRRALSAGLMVTAVDDIGRPTSLVMMTPETVTAMTAGEGHGWQVEATRAHGLGRTPMELLAHQPSLARPFGRSRITREVMSITDRAVRAGYRMEISSDLYAAPALLLLGADSADFVDEDGNKTPLWTWYMGRMKTLPRDEDGQLPQLQVIPQQAMTPFLEMRRSLAAEFSAASCVPISSLGIVQDNPSSAEAIYASKEDLVIEATALNRANGYALDRVIQNMVLLRDGGSAYDMDDELARVSTRWRNPAMPSVVSQSDAMVKQISAIPELAQTDVALEELGYTAEQIIRIRSQIRRAQAAGVLDKLLADRTPAEKPEPDEEPEDDQDPDTPEDEDPEEADDERDDNQDQDDEDERGRRRRRRRRRRVRGDDDDETGR